MNQTAHVHGERSNKTRRKEFYDPHGRAVFHPKKVDALGIENLDIRLLHIWSCNEHWINVTAWGCIYFRVVESVKHTIYKCTFFYFLFIFLLRFAELKKKRTAITYIWEARFWMEWKMVDIKNQKLNIYSKYDKLCYSFAISSFAREYYIFQT